jgi:hypothetical protein
MAEGNVLQTMTGATLAISASLPATYDAAGYGATGISFTTVGKVEDFGEHGGEAQVSTFTPVSDGVIEKFKGSTNYGSMSVMLGCLPSDAGQDIVEAAFASKNRYSVKISYPARTGESTGEIHYLDVLVTRRVWQDGSADNVRKLATTFELCRAPVVVAGT